MPLSRPEARGGAAHRLLLLLLLLLLSLQGSQSFKGEHKMSNQGGLLRAKPEVEPEASQLVRCLS